MRHNPATAPAPTNQLGRIPIRRSEEPARHAAPWELTIYVAGKRKRSFHATESAALKAWKEHKRLEKKFGTLPYLFDADAQRTYDTALHLLTSSGREGASVDDAVRYYLAHAPKKKAPPLAVAVADFVAEKRKLGRSAVHVHDLKVVLEAFARDFAPASATVATIGPDAVRAYVHAAKAARTATNRRNILASFFSWCRRRGWLVGEPPTASITEADLPTAPRKPKAILSPAQTRALFAEFARQAPECLPWLAVQAFAGIRDAEAARLNPDVVDHDARRLRIPAAICKTADDWVMTKLPENLWSWLPREGLAFVEVRKKRWAAIKRALAALPKDDPGRIPSWPYNALRRSFCTYHISQHGDATATAMLLRHSSPKRLYASYLGALRSEAEAAEYFAITPTTQPDTATSL